VADGLDRTLSFRRNSPEFLINDILTLPPLPERKSYARSEVPTIQRRRECPEHATQVRVLAMQRFLPR
jgi:hypothetical protein